MLKAILHRFENEILFEEMSGPL
jgi:RING-variant domain/FHA domain